MRHVSALLVALSIAVATGGRAGVRPFDGKKVQAGDPIDRSQSAALFVGIREFPYDETLAEVKYAVDDAIDLAAVFAMDAKTRLVDPRRVVLALSGDPQKPASQRSLDALRAAGATVKGAAQSDILKLLEEQSVAVGDRGLLIVTFATHGVSSEGTQYLLTASSLLEHRETNITEGKVREIVSRRGVRRALIFVDACRRRLTSDTRETEPDARSVAALPSEMSEFEGQVVISAAAAGDYAYDDDERHNGVFTAAVIDAMRCGAVADSRGYITVDALQTYVEEHVLHWVQRHRDPAARRATQVQCEGRMKHMPLAACPQRQATREAASVSETP